MGLLTLLLTFPVSGPVLAAKSAITAVLREAERELYDEASIQRQLADAERQHQAGALSDADFAEIEDNLLERLVEARRRQQEAESDGADRW